MLFVAILFTNCKRGDNDESISNKDSIGAVQKTDSNSTTVVESEKAKVTCNEKQKGNSEGGDPIQIKTCTYKNFKSITTGIADFNGRYSYQYELFKKQNDKYVKIKNSEFFNQKQSELLSLVIKKIKKDYNDISKNPDTKECFEGMTFPKYSINDLGIQFEDNAIQFNVTFGLSGACMSVDGTSVSFPLNEIEQYLNE